MIKKLRYTIVKQYPKCDKKMYDSGKDICMDFKESVQKSLF